MTNWSPTNKPALSTLVKVNPTYTTKYPGTWRVKSHRVKNVLIARVDTTGKDLIVNPELLMPAVKPVTDPLNSTAVGNVEPVAETIPFYPILHQGTVVKVSGPTWKENPNQLFVVHTDNAYKNNSVRLSYLGGRSAYWPRVPRGYITVVDPADILKNA